MKDLKVGFFVMLGLVLAGLVIFLIGSERRLFESSSEFRAVFENVEGLRRGAPVQMGGVRVGQVSSVSYSEDPGDPNVYVKLSVVEQNAERIRSDGFISIENKGLLGDKMLVIHPGSRGDRVEPGDTIPVKQDDGLMGRLDEVAQEAKGALQDVRSLTKTLSDEELQTDLRQTVHGMNQILKEVNEGDGYPNRLLTDPIEAQNISMAVQNISHTSEEISRTMREIRMAVHGVRTGPSFAHDVLYGEGPKKEMEQIGFAAQEVGTTLKGIRENEGFAHDVLYGGEGDTADALTNVTKLTADLRDIVAGVKDGRGTIGALLMDPSVYEDLKRVLGDVERNDVLRALVRYSIKRDEKKPAVEVSQKPE